MDGPQIRANLEALISSRRIVLGDRLDQPIRLLDEQILRATEVRSEIGRGGFAIVHDAVIPGNDTPVAMKRYPLQRNGKVRGLLERVSRQEVALPLLARAITVGDDVRLRQVESHLALPFAYGYDPVTGDPLVFFEKFDMNLRQYLETLRNLPAKDRGEHIMHVYIGSGDGLAALHLAGYKHRDVKPDNLLINIDERGRAKRVCWSDFDILGLQPSTKSEGLTEQCDEQGIALGTRPYLSPPLLGGMLTMKGARNREHDNWAFGIMLAEAIVPEARIIAEDDFLSNTLIEVRQSLRRHPQLEQRCKEHGLVGLERIIVRATDTLPYDPASTPREHADCGYESMQEFVDDLRDVADGNGSTVARKRASKIAWAYRTDQEVGDQYVRTLRTKKRSLQAAAAIALLSLASFGAYRLWQHRQELKYAQSTEGVARRAADLQPQHLQSFLQARDREFRQEMREEHLPRLSRATESVFPEGSYIENGDKRRYVAGREGPAGAWLDTLATWWRVTGSDDYARWYALYAQRLKLEIESDNSDRNLVAIGRYATTIRDLPQMLATTTDETVREGLKRVHDDGVLASAITLTQYEAKQKTPSIKDEWLIVPYLFDILASQEREQVFKRAEAPPSSSTSGLYALLSSSGVRTCDALVHADGKSFYSLINDKGIFRHQTRNDTVPGFNKGDEDQAVVTQAHVHLLRGVARRIRTITGVLTATSPDQAIIAREQGSQMESYLQSLKQDHDTLISCQERLEGYLARNSTRGAPLPEYLFLPDNSGVGNLKAEMYSSALFLRYLHEEERTQEANNLAATLLRTARFGRSVIPTDLRSLLMEHPSTVAFGLFSESSGYFTGQVGSIYASEASFVDTLWKMQRKK